MSERLNVSPIEIAEYLADFFQNVGDPLTHLKLQKLLYYVQAWHLVYFDGDLYNEEPEAWIHGPVYRSVYDKYKGIGSSFIISENNIDIEKKLKDLNLSEKQGIYLRQVIDHYGIKSAFELEIMTHAEEPWRKARLGYDKSQSSTSKIDMNFAKNYYKDLLAKDL